MASGLQPQRQQHAVALSFPSPGHRIPLMRFCKSLAKHGGFIVTVVDYDRTHNRPQDSHPVEEVPQEHTAAPAASASGSTLPLPQQPLIRRACIPIRGLDASKNLSVSFRSVFDAVVSTGPDLEQLILSLNRHGPPVTCILSDFNMTFPTQDVADKLGIPRIALFPCAASRLLFTHYLSEGEQISIDGVVEALTTKGKRDVFCEGVPGFPTLFCNDIPHYKHVINETASIWEFLTQSWKSCNARAHAVAVNSFEELEASAFAALSKCCNVPIYDVGFWMEPLSQENLASLWKEDKGCLTWLDQQPTSSVLYISFGSITLLSKSQFEEFVNGLLSSQQRFLWVLRPDLVKGIDQSSVVVDIMSKSDSKGLVVDWAPQVQVLSHPSVGGFLTHCGWNSVSESITLGMPLLCWPYFADQPLNARCVVEEWKVGLRLEDYKDSGYIERGEIEKAIQALMKGEEGRIVRQNAIVLKQKSYQCLLQNGSSYMKLKALIKSLM